MGLRLLDVRVRVVQQFVFMGSGVHDPLRISAVF
jgi:hypothetical protein